MYNAYGVIWEINDPIKLHGERRRAEVTASLLQPHSSDVILDVGCGDGYQVSYVISQAAWYSPIDTSTYKLKKGKRRIKEANFICASSEKLPFQPQAFNKVMCLELLEHLKDPSKTMNEIDLVLKRGGVLIVSVPYKERIYMTRCIHCGKLTPLYGHLHSPSTWRPRAPSARASPLLQCAYIYATLSAYILFSALPTRFWKIVDSLSRFLPGIKPSWFINKVQKI